MEGYGKCCGVVVGAEMCSNSYVCTAVKIKRLVKKSLPHADTTVALFIRYDRRSVISRHDHALFVAGLVRKYIILAAA
eukprot:scaffold21413_cov72-Skeletonema_marinoi.AAC.1